MADASRQWLLMAAGGAALALGLAVYLLDRHGVPALRIPPLTPHRGATTFGPLGQWLPSLVHPFAFSLFTAAVLPVRARPAYHACVLWCSINLLFEFSQHAVFKPFWAELLHDGVGPLLRPLVAYGLHGSFDPGDLAASVCGALLAAAWLRRLQPAQEDPHAHR